jgi:tetratricopeptide (TPR) repeat protein
MLGKDEQEVQQYLEKLLDANDLQDLDSWMQIISSAEFASSANQLETAESLYKLALDYAEQHMSPEVIINALLCLSNLYRKQQRTMESQTVYARAMAIFNDLDLGEDW